MFEKNKNGKLTDGKKNTLDHKKNKYEDIFGDENMQSNSWDDSIADEEGYESVNLDSVKIDLQAIELIGKKFAKQNLVFPFAYQNDELYVAICNLNSIQELTEISEYMQCKINVFLSDQDTIERYIKQYYHNNNSANEYRTTTKVKDIHSLELELDEQNSIFNEYIVSDVDTLNDAQKNRENDKNLDKIPKNVKQDIINIETFAREMIQKGMEIHASDIHIESMDEFAYIRYRKDGVLIPSQLSKVNFDLLANRIKIMAEMFTEEVFMPQKGYISFYSGKYQKATLHVLTIPTKESEKIVIKLQSGNRNLPIDDIGLGKADNEILEGILEKKSGLFLVSGLSGSGRTTTLYALLKKLASPNFNILSVEQGITEDIKGVNQVVLSANLKLTVSDFLETVYEHDIDILAIDLPSINLEMFKKLINLSLSGKLVIVTVYFPTVFDAISGLVSMGIEPYSLAASLEGVSAQMIIKRLCHTCMGRKNLQDKVCSACGGTGYKGKIGVFEMLKLSRDYFNLIVKNSNGHELKQKIAEEASTFEKNCQRLFKENIASKEELIRLGFMKVTSNEK